MGLEQFDLVLSYGSLEHIEDSERLFRVIARLLKPGGFFLFMIPALGHYRTDRTDEGWYEDLDTNRQLQWNRRRKRGRPILKRKV